MCGLAGYITHKDAKLTPEQVAKRNGVIKGLMMAMQDRGTDASGVGAITKDGFCVCKKALPARSLIGTKEFHALLKAEPKIWIGHTRWGTVGDKKKDENAHPFVKENIMGAHNGHVDNWIPLDRDANVDSEAIFKQLAKYNNKYKKALRELKGVFAVTWVNLEEPNKVYIVRDSNPLSIVKVNEIQTYFWASTFYALQSVVGTMFDIEKKTIWSPKADHVYIIRDDFNIKKHAIEWKPKDEVTRYDDEDDEAYYNGYYGQQKVDNTTPDYEGTPGYKGIHAAFNSANSSGSACLLSDGQKVTEKEMKEAVAYDCDGEEDFMDSLDNWDALDNLGARDIVTIEDQIDRGCGMCDGEVDIDNDMIFFWHEREKIIVCLACQQELKDSTLIPIDIDYLLGRIQDIESWQEEYDKVQKGTYK